MKDFLFNILGAPIRGLYSLIGDYALAMLVFLISIRIVCIIFDYYMTSQSMRMKIAAPFMAKLKQKFLGKDSDKFMNASMEVLKTTGASHMGKFVPFFFEYPILVFIGYVIYHPISVLFPAFKSSIPVLSEIASKYETSGFQEFNIINAIKTHPEAFDKDVLSIGYLNTKIFSAIDLTKPASFKSFGFIVPLLIIGFYIFNIIKLLIPVFKREKTLKSVGLMLGVYVFVAIILSTTIFSQPQMLYLYLMIFLIIGAFSSKIIDSYIFRTKKQWIKEKNEQCKEILKKYEVEESVSALKEESDNNG